MNRTDRLYAVTEELRRRGRSGTTGARLARLLEVSERTIKRDIDALQQAGAAIRAESGPGGGYVLDGSATLPPVNFSPAQAVAVAVALAAMPPGSPFTPDGVAARGKVLDALGPADRERALELAARVWLRAPTAEADSRAESYPTVGVLRAVEQSLSLARVLTIRYRSASGAVTSRAVEPIVLAHSHGRWYLVAWCQDRAAVRWFRMHRIEKADLTSQRYVPRDVGELGEPPRGAAPAPL